MAYLALFGLGVLGVSQLALPLERHLAVHAFIYETLHNVSCMYVYGAERDQLLALVWCELAIDNCDELCKLGHLLLILSLHSIQPSCASLLGGPLTKFEHSNMFDDISRCIEP